MKKVAAKCSSKMTKKEVKPVQKKEKFDFMKMIANKKK
jgi:hypothetical protein